MKQTKGFTLIELLIVIAIIAILASVVFVILDPLTRFRDSRDSARWQDVSATLEAVKIDQVDNGGDYHSNVSNLTIGQVYMITDGVVGAGCDDQNAFCDADVNDDDNCVDFSFLVDEGYLGDVAVSPRGEGAWTSNITGYTVEREANGALTVRSCESENSTVVELVR